MKIVELRSENIKALRAVEIRPDGKPVVLTGDNEQGKSSVLDSIFIALTGKTPDKPIRDGAAKARVRLDLGEVTVERRITPKGVYLEVKGADGTKVTSPQTLLNSLIGQLTFDPLAFTNMNSAEQRAALMEAAGLDLSDLDAAYSQAYEERTHANREAKTAEAHWRSMPDAPEGTPEEEQSASDLIAEIGNMESSRRARENAIGEQQRLKQRRYDLRNQIVALEDQLAAAKKALDRINMEIEAVEIPEAASDEEISAAKQRLADLETTNASVRMAKTKAEAEARAREARNKANQADAAVQRILKEKADRISNADFGVEGLTVDDSGVLYEGQPFSQLSTARQIQVSALLAMKANPKLRIILIRDGALIGSRIWETLVSLAKEHDYQLWVEKFQEEPGAVGLHLHAGEIVAVDGEPVAGELSGNEDEGELDLDL